MAKDYYKILGISKSASDDEIKRAYRKLAQECHPDKPGGNAEKFKEINEAYQILSDKQKRANYDRFGSDFNQAGSGFQGGGFQDFSDIFDMFGAGRKKSGASFGWEDIFGGAFNGFGGETEEKRGQDILIDLNITLENAANGILKQLEIYKGVRCEKCKGSGGEQNSGFKKCNICHGKGKIEERRQMGFFAFSQVRPCDACHGRGEIPVKKCSKCGGDGRIKENSRIEIQVPAGIDDGEMLKIIKQGEAGMFGAPAGDLLIRVHVLPHNDFKRKGNNLYYQQVISFTQAVLGDKINIPTLEGNTNINIPAGIESGAILRLEGRGIQSRRGKGDLFVEIKIRTPKKVSNKARKLLEELEKEL